MIKNETNKTKPWVRLVVICAAVLLLFSTFAMYMGMIMNTQNNNPNISKEEYEKLSERYAELSEKQNKKTEEVSKKYFDSFSKYRSEVKAFNAADVTEVKTRDLKVGKGDEVKTGNYAALYIGWLKDEKIFDSSFDNADNPTKIASVISEKQTGNMIAGWDAGLDGMRIGGVREITIPSELGYGDQEMGDIPKNSVLKFIVMALEPIGDDWTDELSEVQSKMQSYFMQQQSQSQTTVNSGEEESVEVK